MTQDTHSTSPSGASSATGYFMRLGLKNIFRQRSRAMLALGAIGVSVALVIVGITWVTGVQKQVFSELSGEYGHLVIARKDYFDKSRFNPLRYSIKEANALQQAIGKIEGVSATTQRIDFGLVLGKGDVTKEVRSAAIDVEQFVRYSSLPSNIVAGRFLKPGEKAVVLGKTLADELGLKPGDKVDAIGLTVYQSFSADDFQVAGVFDLGSARANRILYMPIEAAQSFLEMEGSSSRILVYGASFNDSEILRGRIQQAQVLPEGTSLRTWRDEKSLVGIYGLLSGFRSLVVIIICFVAGLGILNMMTVYVLERRKEIGVLMAMGMTHGQISGMFFYEAALYGLLGSLVGVLLGVPTALYMHLKGVAVSFDKMEGMPVAFSRLYGDFSLQSVMVGVATGTLLGILGMCLPVFKTFSMQPIDAIRKS